MAKRYKSRGARLTSLKTKRRVEPGPIESREKAVLQVTAKIHRLQAERRKLNTRAKQITAELRGLRRGLRIVLQKDEQIILNATSLVSPGVTVHGPDTSDVRSWAFLDEFQEEQRKKQGVG